MIGVLIVDDNAIVRRGVRSVLEEAGDIEILGEADNGRDAITLARENGPAVVLLDVRMPVMDGLSAVAELSRMSRVMMLTHSDEDEAVTAAIRGGASGYLVHGRFQPEELHQRIRDLAAGDVVISPAVAPALFEALRRGPQEESSRDDRDALTAREAEIMNLISQGRKNSDIAAALVVSEKTVKNHVNRIYGKLGAHNRAEAIAMWLGTDRPS